MCFKVPSISTVPPPDLLPGRKRIRSAFLKRGKQKMEYHCTENNCKYDGNKPYRLCIPTEVCEQHNMATPFCPHCGAKLEEKVQANA